MSMINTPFEDIQFVQLKSLKHPSIYRYTDITHTPPKYRYHLLIPCNGVFIECNITTKIDKKKRQYSRGFIDAYNSLIFTYINEECVIDCNQVELYESIQSLKNKLKSKKEFKLELQLSSDEIKNVYNAIKNSPHVSPDTKSYIPNS